MTSQGPISSQLLLVLLIYCKYDAYYGNPKDKFIEFDNSREIFEAATDECILDPQEPSDDGLDHISSMLLHS